MSLIFKESISLSFGTLSLFDVGYALEPSFIRDPSYRKQGFLRSKHCCEVYSQYDIAVAQICIYIGPPPIDQVGDLAVSIPIESQSGSIQFDGMVETAYGQMEIAVAPGLYLLTVFQTDLKQLDENNVPQLKVDIYIEPGSAGTKGKTILARAPFQTGDEFVEEQPESYSELTDE